MIGQRVRHCDSRKKATVRFIGQIKNQEFFGIEYDEPNSGKYDGSYEGVRYFTCAENQGAFVKRKKLLFGQDL